MQTSSDGGLKQSATVSERVPIAFSDGSNALLPGAYIEFAERMVLPEFEHLKVSNPLDLLLMCCCLWNTWMVYALPAAFGR